MYNLKHLILKPMISDNIIVAAPWINSLTQRVSYWCNLFTLTSTQLLIHRENYKITGNTKYLNYSSQIHIIMFTYTQKIPICTSFSSPRVLIISCYQLALELDTHTSKTGATDETNNEVSNNTDNFYRIQQINIWTYWFTFSRYRYRQAHITFRR